MAAKKKTTKKKRAKRRNGPGPKSRKPRVPWTWDHPVGEQDPPYYMGDDPREPADVGDILYLEGRFQMVEGLVERVMSADLCHHSWLVKVNDDCDMFMRAHQETRDVIEKQRKVIIQMQRDMMAMQTKLEILLSLGILEDALSAHPDLQEKMRRAGQKLDRFDVDPNSHN